MAITASQIEKAVNNQIMLDGSSIEGFVRINESDQYLYPDLDSFVILPWRPRHGRVARLICDIHNPDGSPFVGDPRGVLKRALDQMKIAADRAYRNGANIIILSDRGVDENHVAIPSLLAVSTLEQHLVRTKKRTAVSVILESAEPRDVHHFATLLGYGARAINPYLAQETIGQLIDEGLLDKEFSAAVNDYNNAILHGIVKIASKMGISTVQSYQSAQIFEAIGISKAVVDEYFTNTVSRVEGIGLKEIEQMVDRNHTKAFDPLGLGCDTTLDSAGAHKARSGQEDHMYNPQTIHLLQESTRTGSYSFVDNPPICVKIEGQ